MMAIVIRLIGGPMDGVEHELFGNLVPAAIGINQPEDPKSPEKHWYYLSDDEQSAMFISTGASPKEMDR